MGTRNDRKLITILLITLQCIFFVGCVKKDTIKNNEYCDYVDVSVLPTDKENTYQIALIQICSGQNAPLYGFEFKTLDKYRMSEKYRYLDKNVNEFKIPLRYIITIYISNPKDGKRPNLTKKDLIKKPSVYL